MYLFAGKWGNVGQMWLEYNDEDTLVESEEHSDQESYGNHNWIESVKCVHFAVIRMCEGFDFAICDNCKHKNVVVSDSDTGEDPVFDEIEHVEQRASGDHADTGQRKKPDILRGRLLKLK